MAWREDAHINKLRVGSGTTTTVLTGGVFGITMTVGAEATNTVNVAIQLNDASGNAVSGLHAIHWYVSDNAAGDNLAASAITTVAIGTDGHLIENIANNAGVAVSETDGDIDIDFTKAGDDTYYLCAIVPATGEVVVSDAITFTT